MGATKNGPMARKGEVVGLGTGKSRVVTRAERDAAEFAAGRGPGKTGEMEREMWRKAIEGKMAEEVAEIVKGALAQGVVVPPEAISYLMVSPRKRDLVGNGLGLPDVTSRELADNAVAQRVPLEKFKEAMGMRDTAQEREQPQGHGLGSICGVMEPGPLSDPGLVGRYRAGEIEALLDQVDAELKVLSDVAVTLAGILTPVVGESDKNSAADSQARPIPGSQLGRRIGMQAEAVRGVREYLADLYSRVAL